MQSDTVGSWFQLGLLLADGLRMKQIHRGFRIQNASSALQPKLKLYQRTAFAAFSFCYRRLKDFVMLFHRDSLSRKLDVRADSQSEWLSEYALVVNFEFWIFDLFVCSFVIPLKSKSSEVVLCV